MKEKKLPNKRKTNRNLLIAAILVLYTVVAVIAWISGQSDGVDKSDPDQGNIQNDEKINETNADNESGTDLLVDQGLVISRIGGYTGAYVEDGSNEDVTDVMMIVVENQSEQDLQLARINMTYTEFTAQFEVTNLPAGASAVLLEKNRHNVVEEEYISVEMQNVVFFSETMGLQEDKIEIQGLNGALNVKNISGSDISGDIYIYYKNNGEEGFLGGITYRAKVENGLKAGELAQLSAGHYSPETSTILMVTCGD